MLDLNTFIFISVAVAFGIVGIVVWIADSGISDKYKTLLQIVILAITAGLIGLFFVIDDDSQFEYAGYEKMKSKSGNGQQRQSMMEEGGSGGGEPQEQQSGGGGGGGGEQPQEQSGGGGGGGGGEQMPIESTENDNGKDCDVCPQMVAIAPGMALLGSTHQISSGGLNSGPAAQKNFHEQFSIGKFEVTVGEFDAFVKDAGYKTTGKCRGNSGSKPSYLSPNFPQTPDHPVVCINWVDAARYTLWLTAKTNKSYRLPTEAEWEYAARSGVTRPYTNGEHLNTRSANFRPRVGNRHNGTVPVGSYPPNKNAMHDVHGNAWELVADCWSQFYQVAAAGNNPKTNGLDCTRRIVKGGAWSSPQKQTGFPMRGAVPKELAMDTLGFRVMREDSRLSFEERDAQNETLDPLVPPADTN